MKVRFQADANLDPDIGLGLQRRDRSIDFRLASGVIPDGMPDLDVLELAAGDSRVLVTNDLRIHKHFVGFIAVRDSPGVLLVPSGISIGETIEGLFLCWLGWTAEEMRNQIRWLVR